MSQIRPLVAAVALALIAAVGGCAASVVPSPSTAETPTQWSLPPEGAPFDYQLGGGYEPADAVEIVARDRTDEPAPGLYSICYVNGFQTQPDELDIWPDDLLLRDPSGAPVVDPAWPDEVILDTSTVDRRDGIVALVGPWIRGCADDGFDAVEFDNLDSFSRGEGLTFEDNAALAAELVAIAHDSGLAAAQKNAAELSAQLRAAARFDFAVAEECASFDECSLYAEVYGPHVLDIEYTDDEHGSFADACAAADAPRSMVLRDRDLTMPGDPGHVFALCD
ncbi:hypothetical protein JOD63_000683 [Microbacterium terrae]|uniref:Glycoside-hydrolase family GH114 TIM-barrel domain-containing protein n=1 Tax=Microbacterium terrae TaxID=69369 RepID=A0A0M2HLH8_9MICO|nr:endo alpha-1,4 polygalactosaminidase [Microbacterium terrae]KJL45753.1 hypothetical protein RS81_00083 [Microbacterium terrae]MBP1076715.1 hypothetical protein [Microbacterium terrae]GLJ97543.1 hypothetical protein GCM10017594_07400 [Microbacterium terrae]